MTIELIAKDLGVDPMMLLKWLRRADIDDVGRPGYSCVKGGELREARKRGSESRS